MIIKEGEGIKYGWGIAWRNYHDLSYTAYPIPFNFLIRWLRSLWLFLAKPPLYRTPEYNHGYEEGRLDGFNTGLHVGKWQGIEMGRKIFIEEVDWSEWGIDEKHAGEIYDKAIYTLKEVKKKVTNVDLIDLEK